jgi:hypothetical protein
VIANSKSNGRGDNTIDRPASCIAGINVGCYFKSETRIQRERASHTPGSGVGDKASGIQPNNARSKRAGINAIGIMIWGSNTGSITTT